MFEKYIDDEEQEVSKYNNVPNDIKALLKTFFNRLGDKLSDPELVEQINDTLIQIDNHPIAPDKNIIVSFKVKNTSYFVIYTNYKIELSEYTSDSSGYGTEHYQNYNFVYEINGYRESTGFFDEFNQLLLYNLNIVDEKDIWISDEEN